MGQITVDKNVGGIEGLCVIKPAVHGDDRGYFMETYNEKDMKEAGIDIKFVQDNQSMSVKGVLRGLHFQKQYPQCKLVRAVRGTVFDVAVDLRADSKTYGKWYGVTLSAENKVQFLIPEGFAHGANSHFLRPAGPHFPASQGHIKRPVLEIGRAERGLRPANQYRALSQKAMLSQSVR